VEAPGGEKWEHLKKSGGKQWQATPKNLPRMQRTIAIKYIYIYIQSSICRNIQFQIERDLPELNYGVSRRRPVKI